MSNQIFIDPVEFHNARTSEVKLGFTIRDEYGRAYFDEWDSIPQLDADFLLKVVDCVCETGDEGPLCDAFNILRYMCDNEVIIFVGGKECNYEEVRDLVKGRMG